MNPTVGEVFSLRPTASQRRRPPGGRSRSGSGARRTVRAVAGIIEVLVDVLLPVIPRFVARRDHHLRRQTFTDVIVDHKMVVQNVRRVVRRGRAGLGRKTGVLVPTRHDVELLEHRCLVVSRAAPKIRTGLSERRVRGLRHLTGLPRERKRPIVIFRAV